MSDRGASKDETIRHLHEVIIDLQEENKRFKQALGEIATRKMSQYLTKDDMLNDFIEIANQALQNNRSDEE